MGKFLGEAELGETCSLLMTVGITIVTCLLREPGATVGSPLFNSVGSCCGEQRGCKYGGDERTCLCCSYRRLTSSFPELWLHAAFCLLTTLSFFCLFVCSWRTGRMRQKISRKSVSEESNLVFQKAASSITREWNIPNTRLCLASAYCNLFAHLLLTG